MGWWRRRANRKGDFLLFRKKNNFELIYLKVDIGKMALAPHSKKKICYYYDSDIGNYYYGQGHPMKPHRIRMTHNLLLNYGIYRKMEIYSPFRADFDEITRFHSDDYANFLKRIRPDNVGDY